MTAVPCAALSRICHVEMLARYRSRVASWLIKVTEIVELEEMGKGKRRRKEKERLDGESSEAQAQT